MRRLASDTAANVQAHVDKLANKVALAPERAGLAPMEVIGRELAAAWIQVAHGEPKPVGLNESTDGFLDVSGKAAQPFEEPPADWKPDWMP
jgi:hypothetical protein